MAAGAEQVEVLSMLKEAKNQLDTSTEAAELVSILSSLHCRLKESPFKNRSFRTKFFVDFSNYLLQSLATKWFSRLLGDRRCSVDAFFLEGPPGDAFFVLSQSLAVVENNDSSQVKATVGILERWLGQNKLKDLFWEEELALVASSSKIVAGQAERLVNKIVTLPDLVANRLQTHTSRPTFSSANYCRLLARSIMEVLSLVIDRLRCGSDCSLAFSTAVLGKACLQGHADVMVDYLLPRFDEMTLKDPLWCRLVQRLITGVCPQGLESLVSSILCRVKFQHSLSQHNFALCRFLGDAVILNEKLLFLLTRKFVLIRWYSDETVLLNIANYLSSSKARKSILIETLVSTFEVWSDASALKHTPYDQHLYITKAVIIFGCQLEDEDCHHYKDKLLQILMHGVHSHLSSPIDKLRRLGMVVGECVSKKLDSHGNQLTFEYEADKEIELLWSLAKRSEVCKFKESSPAPDKNTEVAAGSGIEVVKIQKDSHSDDSDDDDDLQPYLMPDDLKSTGRKPPVYLLDLKAGLLAHDDHKLIQVSLETAEKLIRGNPSNISDIAPELTKILLHLQDNFYFPEFGQLRHKAMVAAAVVYPQQVVPYLTTEFYSPHYNIGQRIDILEVLSSAAKELSSPTSVKSATALSSTDVLPPHHDPGADMKSWQKIVQNRIDSKTKRYHKSSRRDVPIPVANRFAPVAGLFFYPLMKTYDFPLNTMNLLDQDCFVLGRLVYTLGIVLHSAAHTPAARLMASRLVEFIWTLRFHSERYVRYSLIFAVCMVLTSVSSAILVLDMHSNLLESHSWLQLLLQSDDDAQVQNMTLQALTLLESVLKEGINIQ
eukprot:m.128884 g.128884  ORF g.128884 m.128884 type:complete len:830 (+) comp37956_c0_seq36:517-3006(+)